MYVCVHLEWKIFQIYIIYYYKNHSEKTNEFTFTHVSVASNLSVQLI